MIDGSRVRVPDSAIDDLMRRLRSTRLPIGVTTEGGVPVVEIKRILDYWQGEYDWRRCEVELNRFAHFKKPVDGCGIHFIHERASKADALPLLLLHGWPGSFVEMLDVIPLLAKDFHVVVPSLPGYGFSDAPTTTGFSNRRIADIMVSLMESLSYSRFGVQGGDWGAGIATWIARRHGSRLHGMHLNYIPGSYYPHTDNDLTSDESAFLSERAKWGDVFGAYGHVQRTRPLTLSYGLSDSPAGLAAWIFEKFTEWSDPASDLNLDRILTNVVIYWVTNTVGSSVRLYLESAQTPLRFERNERLEPPCAIVRCPLEAPFPPREWIERVYHVQRWTDFPAGGHFAAMEVPGLFATDVMEFFQS